MKNNKFFDKILYGTQYYRAPTPLPTEWEGDLANMASINLDTIQIRVQWRQNERKEGEYYFGDVDKLFELAAKNNLKVVFKFLLENAPQYVFDKYNGSRIAEDGSLIRGGAHGAFYVGGWLPCFANPKVRERAIKFVEVFSERYAKHSNLILWNVWNEPRNRPIGECYCDACRHNYGKWLRDQYKTIEEFNTYFGVAEEGFDNMSLPAMTQGYWDIFLFKKFKSGKAIYDNLKFVYDAIKLYDKIRPIMSHVGCCSAIQYELDDLSNDFEISKSVDFYGTSFPAPPNMETNDNRLAVQLIADYMRAVDPNYFVHELYPGLGLWAIYDSPEDMRFKLYTILGSGSQGIVYWQYRAERLGCENDCAGIVEMDGRPKPITAEVASFGKLLDDNANVFSQATAAIADIGIVFDFDSLLMSTIEDGSGVLYDLSTSKYATEYYSRAHTGMYKLFRNLDYSVDYIGSPNIEQIHKYKVIYFPYYAMANASIDVELQKFVTNGGIILADEGFGLRQLNGWLQIGDIAYPDTIQAKMTKRRWAKDDAVMTVGGLPVKVVPYMTNYTVRNSEVLATFETNEPAIQQVSVGKGKIVLFGTSIGYSYNQAKEQGWENFVSSYLKLNSKCQTTKYSNVKSGVYCKEMILDSGNKLHIVSNWSKEIIELAMDASDRVIGQTVVGNTVKLQPYQSIIITSGEN